MPLSPADDATTTVPTVYQLRVVLAGVSPLIWRQLLVPDETTIAGLHAVLQTAFGWGGEHLHRFVIHGRYYGIAYAGGPGFRDNARQVRLADLGLRPTERFTYDYDFTDGWRLDLRLEQIQTATPGRTYPRCSGGRRAGPPEGSGGAWAFTEATEPHLVFAATLRAAEVIGTMLDEDADNTRVCAYRDELAAVAPLLGLERFDRRTLNRALAEQAPAARNVA